MPRWDIFDRDNARDSEPRTPQYERPKETPDAERSAGRAGGDNSTEAMPRRRAEGRQTGTRAAGRQRTPHREHGRVYRLRRSELEAMADIGKFRSVDVQDLARFAYGGDELRMRRDLGHLRNESLVEQKTVLRAHKSPRRIVTLTEQGHRLIRRANAVRREQRMYHGFVKTREINHDADLYAVYQQAAAEIGEQGGTITKVTLDFELKAAVQREKNAVKELSKDEQIERLRAFAEERGLPLRGATIHVPDIQIEYETRDGERERANLELVSENYRSQGIRSKADSGFRIYARGNDATRVRRALHDTRAVERILSV